MSTPSSENRSYETLPRDGLAVGMGSGSTRVPFSVILAYHSRKKQKVVEMARWSEASTVPLLSRSLTSA